MPDSRVLRGAPGVLSVVFDDGGEAPVDPGTVTVTITRADGSTVVAGAATAGTLTAPRTYTLAAQTALDRLTAVWTSSTSRVATTYHDIVGGFTVTLAAIRAMKNLSDTIKFTAAELDAARTWFEDLAEEFCGFSSVPRFRVDTLDGNGTTSLQLSRAYTRRLLSASIAGASVPTTTWSLWETGSIYAGTGFPLGHRNIVVAYEHGMDSTPADIARAALSAIRWRLLNDESQLIDDRAISLTNEFGNVQLSQPGQLRATGLPEVDAVLARYRIPVVA